MAARSAIFRASAALIRAHPAPVAAIIGILEQCDAESNVAFALVTGGVGIGNMRARRCWYVREIPEIGSIHPGRNYLFTNFLFARRARGARRTSARSSKCRALIAELRSPMQSDTNVPCRAL